MFKFYSLFDKKTNSYSDPFLAKYESDAMRSVQVAFDNPKSPLTRWPADYALVMVAHWDPTTGQLMPTVSGHAEHVLEVVALVPKPGQMGIEPVAPPVPKGGKEGPINA